MFSPKLKNLLSAVLFSFFSLFQVIIASSEAKASQTGNAVVIVNSSSPFYGDFEHYIEPYLKNFGIPYSFIDISLFPISDDISDYSLIIIGHKEIDKEGLILTVDQQNRIVNAVSNGTGLINFDFILSDGLNIPHYSYVQDIFNFSYHGVASTLAIDVVQGLGSYRIDCWLDETQQPVLATKTSLSPSDGNWDEYKEGGRPFPAIFAHHGEWENYGLLPMSFFLDQVPNGTYEVIANLYTGTHTRYFFGFNESEVLAGARWVDNVRGEGDSTGFFEYSFGTVEITNGRFELWIGDGDNISGSAGYYGWAWIRIVPTGISTSPLHYIAERHKTGERVNLKNSMNLQAILPTESQAVMASAGSNPFLIATDFGNGRAVQFAGYGFMDLDILGPVYGLDDLVWRSMVWAARKPFVMQGMPPLLTFRVDDCSGPMWWAAEAATHGLKPWIGTFLADIDADDTAAIKQLVDVGMATTSVHAYSSSDFFYWGFSDAQIAANFEDASRWHTENGIPISSFVVPSYYQIGFNALPLMKNWGMEFIATHMNAGSRYGAPWVEIGPYRYFYSGPSNAIEPVYYADFLPVPSHPDVDGHFFNIVTEIRDNAGYEWYPTNNVKLSIDRGVAQLKRAFDSLALPTLFTHEYHIQRIESGKWSQILAGVIDGVSSYNPFPVTMDEGAKYARALATSRIVNSEYDPASDTLTTTFDGDTDITTYFYAYFDHDSEIKEKIINVPIFSSHLTVSSILHEEGTVDHFVLDVIGDQTAGVPFQVTVEARDSGDVLVASYTGTATISDTTGTITPVTTGNFVGGRWTGNVTIATVSSDVSISVHDGSAVGTSNVFAVAAPPLTERVINLWEDEHQTPVLVTFTNPALLNNHDGNWDEFKYSGRPFPAIFAGHNEWENNGLQPMHFHAGGIANGRYEVWADLYTGRHTRHYYGYSESEALSGARYVDNVQGAGGSDSHEEYLLGVIEITDGTFNLWAGDGDVLDGTNYYYGWAHIRLVPLE